MALLGARYYTPNAFDVDASGTPVAGGKLYFYASGTTTLLDTFSDSALSVPNANPVVADSSGHFGSIFLYPTQPYSVVFTDSSGDQIWAYDPVGPGIGGATTSTAGIIGEMRLWAGNQYAVPPGWYICDGSAIDTGTLNLLFSVIGYTFGGSNEYFCLPDMRGRVAAGVDTSGTRITSAVAGFAGNTLGASGGSQYAQQDNITVTSTLTDPGHQHVESVPNKNTIAFGTGTQQCASFDAGGQGIKTLTATTGITISVSASGSNTGQSQNVQPTVMLYYIIYAGQ